MLSRILVNGAIAGLITGGMLGVTVALWHDQPPAWGMALGYATMLTAFTAIFVGIKRHRDEALGGVIRFWPAFGMGLAISAVAGVIYVMAWEAVLAAMSVDYIGPYIQAQIEAKRAGGASAAEIAAYRAEMQAFAARYRDPLYRMPLTFVEIFPVGVLVSLVSAALLRKPGFLPARV